MASKKQSLLQHIASTTKLQELLAEHGNKPVATKAKVIGIHFQFAHHEAGNTDNDRVVAIAIGNDALTSTAVVLEVASLSAKEVIAGLKEQLEDPDTIKVTFDVGRAAKWLHRYGMTGVALTNCLDLQLVYRRLVNKKASKASLTDIASQLGGRTAVALEQEVATFSASLKPEAWTKSPLTTQILRNLVTSMQLYVRCYAVCGVEISKLPDVYTATYNKWCCAVAMLDDQRSSSSSSTSAAAQASGTRSQTKTLPSPPSPANVNVAPTSAQLTPPSSVLNIKYVLSTLKLLVLSNKKSLVQGSVPVVGVHFQFTREKSPYPGENDDDQLVAISIVGANPLDTAVVLQIDYLNPATVCLALKTLLSDPNTVKVMHDVHRAAFCLHRNGLTDVQLVNCIDLQVVYEDIVSAFELHATLLQIVEHCKSVDTMSGLAQTTQSFKTRVKPADLADWERRPLPESLLRTLANDAQLLAQCYVELNKKSPLTAACAATTNTRWQYAIANQGHHAIWFDPEADNQPRSLECFHSNDSEGSKTKRLPSGIPPLELQCDLDPLLDLLPSEYEDAILEIDDYHTKLVDVCLDVGRIPYVYTGKKQRVVLSKNGATVSKDTIDEIIANLGGEMRIGDDNRAGIDRQLHRISVMRSKTDEVYGLTMRVGRALRNAACVLTDLLLSARHADKSVLVLGHPGSGKTTLIRDVARCVSETMENVCIIDTSNEIGGDGLVPHECVGWARRMMVRSLEAQAGVMVECVQNHTVETLIVDEIGRKAEVLAASTVRQRGPRLIASAHGDFRALLKNPDLKGLVGGSQQVIVGDSAAAQSATKSKLQTQRAGNPIFDVIVELDHVVRGRCRVIWDVAKAVDSVLEGNGYSFETRQWDASTRGVQVLGV